MKSVIAFISGLMLFSVIILYGTTTSAQNAETASERAARHIPVIQQKLREQDFLGGMLVFQAGKKEFHLIEGSSDVEVIRGTLEHDWEVLVAEDAYCTWVFAEASIQPEPVYPCEFLISRFIYGTSTSQQELESRANNQSVEDFRELNRKTLEAVDRLQKRIDFLGQRVQAYR